MAEITYICKRTVVSTKPVLREKSYIPSVLDRVMEQSHLNILYYFEIPNRGDVGEMTKRLSQSLSELLTYFPVVTGRLIKNKEGHWTIKCNDAGVRVVEANAKGSVQEWLKLVDREMELKLVCWEEMFHKPYFWSTFYVQLTEFEEGGLAIGLSCFHLLADLTCASIFIKAWFDITLSGKMLDPPLFSTLPRRRPDNCPNHKPYTDLIDHYKSSIQKSHLLADTKYATVTLSFSDPMVRACMAEASGPNHTSPSPFDALSGLLWCCTSEVKGLRNELIDMSICVDLRKILGLDKEFFGNCMVCNKVQTMSLKENKLSDAAKAIGEAVANMDIDGIMDLIEWLEGNDCHSSPLMNSFNLICTSLETVNPYLAMFEEGYNPTRVSYSCEPVVGLGQVMILPSPPGEGPLSRVVMVTLPEDEIVKVCEDDMILRFSPTFLMGAGRK
ncbi:hypothetical protein K2173_005852 [Erythroxylum novogranatense]|uniref:Uncharacterized protein n=1 Tax=Erythroxylum novogranatense TaxID=1862640 RepID=A0AAV8U2U8_9ROSI|nr:hypothetical protein K2173_005852 [Erythroxylum novogranatense]